MKEPKKKPVGRPSGPKTVRITGLVKPATAKEIRKRAKNQSIGAVLDQTFTPNPEP